MFRDIFLVHLFEDIKYHSSYAKNFGIVLCEEHGSVPDYEIYVNQIVEYFINQIKTCNLKEEQEYLLTLPKDYFEKFNNCFFEQILFNLNLKFSSSKELILNGHYNPGFSTYKKSTDKIACLMMSFDISCPRNDFEKQFKRLLSHEFIHAYQDYNMLKTSGKGLLNIFLKDKYFANLQNSNNQSELIEDLSEIIYYIYKPEVNAYAGAIRTFVEENGELGNRELIINVVKNCYVFNKYEELEEKIDKLGLVTDKQIQDSLLKYWNDNTSYTKNSFFKMIRFVKRRLIVIQQKISKIASKQIADYFQKKRTLSGYDTPFKKY